MEAGWTTVTSCPVTSHPLDGLDAQDVEAFRHDGGRGFTEQHPPHVDLYHLTWTETERRNIEHFITSTFIYSSISQKHDYLADTVQSRFDTTENKHIIDSTDDLKGFRFDKRNLILDLKKKTKERR